MLSVQTRTATTDDLPALVAFLGLPEVDLTFQRPLTQRGPLQDYVQLPDDGFWRLALHQEAVIGCFGSRGALHPPGTDHPTVQLTTVAVHPHHQGRGLARRLVTEVEDEATRRHGPTHFRTITWCSNAASLRLFASHGYQAGDPHDDPRNRPPGIRTVPLTKPLLSLGA